MNMRLVDDYGDAGFGGYYAIEVSPDDEWTGDEYLGERDCPEARTVAALGTAKRGGPNGPFTFTSQRKARQALAAARRGGR